MFKMFAMSMLVGFALLSSGCWHNNRCCAPVRSSSSCCPPGSAPAVIPAPPPGTVGYVPAGSVPAYYRR